LGLCKEFIDFLERAEKRTVASEAAEEYLNQRFDSIEASLARIESEGNFITAKGKKELIHSLDEAVEEAAEVFRSYGFMYTRWPNQRDLELRNRIDNLVIKKESNSVHYENPAEVFEVVERPADLIRGELIWLDVASNGYHSQRSQLSFDRNRLIIEMRAGSDPSTRFKVYDLDAGEYDVFALPFEAVQIVWTDQYNYKWGDDEILTIYSHTGQAVSVNRAGKFSEFSYSSVNGLEFFGFSDTGNFGLFRGQRGRYSSKRRRLLQ